MNKMKEIQVERVTLNIGTGGPGEGLDKAMKLLKNLTGLKPVATTTNKRIPSWGLRPGLQIGCKVTLRGKKAEAFLKSLFEAKSNQLEPSNFDNQGNFSFGISEYLDIPGAEYDMSIGIIGLETAVTLSRPGFRIKNRRIMSRKIPTRHRITKEESIEFIRNKYSVKIGDEE
ncbi:MAG: 50S ribosomal protein L5 [Nanoarchaeota archaeon]